MTPFLDVLLFYNPNYAPACRLYTMNGELVTDTQQFENGGYYIAVGADIGGLKVMNYGQQRPDFHTSPKAQRKSVHTPQQRAA